MVTGVNSMIKGSAAAQGISSSSTNDPQILNGLSIVEPGKRSGENRRVSKYSYRWE